MDVVIPTSPRGLLVTNVTQPRVKLGKRRQFELLTKEEKDEQQHPMEHFWAHHPLLHDVAVATLVPLRGEEDRRLENGEGPALETEGGREVGLVLL